MLPSASQETEVDDHIPWPWAESLGSVTADPHRVFRVKRIRLGLVRDRCRELGLREGAEIRCRKRSSEGLLLELPNRDVCPLELPYAWFVQVEPVPQAVGRH